MYRFETKLKVGGGRNAYKIKDLVPIKSPSLL